MKTSRTNRDRPRTRARTRQVVVPKLTRDAPEAARDAQQRDGSQLVEQLRQLLQDQDAPAAARVNAARTLAELDGLIGKHQQAPDRTALASLGSLTREDLTSELERLRTLFGMGLVR